MFENVFNIAMRAVKEWVPKKRYLSEGEYRDDLCKVLRKKIERREESGFFSLGSSEKYIVQKESGRHLADLAVINSEKVGIEFKYNFRTKSQRNRLVGQVKDYLKEYLYVIIVLCGYVDTQQFDALRYDLKEYEESSGFSLGQPQKVVKIISKSKVGYKKTKRKPKATKKKPASRKATKPKRTTRKKTKPKTTKTRKKKTSKTKRRKK